MGITWKEVHNQNNAALIQTLLNSGQAIGDGIATLLPSACPCIAPIAPDSGNLTLPEAKAAGRLNCAS